MELLQLTYFCHAAENENFSETAHHFHVPPSAVSQSIKRLEGELGISLFDRTSNRLRLNDRGKRFYETVRQGLTLLGDAKRQAADEQMAPTGELRLLVATNRRPVTLAIQRYRAEYPRVSFLVDHRPEQAYDRYDLIISDDLSLPHEEPPQLLVTEELLLAMECHHPLAKRDKLSLRALSKEKFVCMNTDSRLFALTERLCLEQGFSPSVVIRCDDPYYVRRYVSLGLGVALVPAISWQGLFDENVVLRPVGDYVRRTYAMLPKDRYHSRAVRLFTETLLACCNSK